MFKARTTKTIYVFEEDWNMFKDKAKKNKIAMNDILPAMIRKFIRDEKFVKEIKKEIINKKIND